MTKAAVTLMTITCCEPYDPPPGLVVPGMVVYRSLPSQHRDAPSWAEIETAIRRMDDRCHPIVTLSCVVSGALTDAFEDEESFNVVGGDGRWALFETMGAFWRFEDPDGSTEEDRLWESDQGYFCERRNIVTDIRAVLAMARAYYETGSYEGLTKIGLRSRRW